MARRRVIGDNPLDLMVPKTQASAERGAKKPAVRPRDPDSEDTVEAPSQASDVRAAPGQYLTLELGGQEFGVRLQRIREIVGFIESTPVPKTPAWIPGVINLRGSVVPVIDLAAKFGFSSTEVRRRTCLVLVEVDFDEEGTVLAILVDSVRLVLDLDAEHLEPPPSFGTPVHLDYLLGMGRVEDRFIPLLDLDHVLTLEELVQASEVGSDPTPMTVDEPKSQEPRE